MNTTQTFSGTFKYVAYILTILIMSISNTAIAKPEIIDPADGTLPSGTSTITWTENENIQRYSIKVGTTGKGSKDITHLKPKSTDRSLTISGLPTDGSAVYLRFGWKVKGKKRWKRKDYIFTSSTTSTKPDYDVFGSIDKIRFGTGPEPVTLLISISEINNGINTDDLVLRLYKHHLINFTFDAGQQQTSRRNKKSLSNSDWELTEESHVYKLRYIGNGGEFPKKSMQYIELRGEYIPRLGSSGSSGLFFNISNGSGDIDLYNNTMSFDIQYDAGTNQVRTSHY